jgi:A/G-specific adenine glycosylase
MGVNSERAMENAARRVAGHAALEAPLASELPNPTELAAFRAKVLAEGERLYRDLPWRRTHDPYAIWVSEVMLQQTQVSRVDGRWQRWLERFPSVADLARAQAADVLEEWQGMGYNRRALSLQRAAQEISAQGDFPREASQLMALPGIGPATAAGIRAFAWNLPATYLETNVRTVFLHELFPHEANVPDRRIVPLVEASCPKDASDPADNPRSWYYALLDYGAHLKATLPNPSRRSATHTRQSRFEGSHRQKRAALLRLLIAHRDEGGANVATLAEELSSLEIITGRLEQSVQEVADLLAELSGEGFCNMSSDDRWSV